MTLLLTPDELAQVTGHTQPGRQAEWLREHGWRYVLDRSRRPQVAHAEFLHHMTTCAPADTVRGPDLDAMDAV